MAPAEVSQASQKAVEGEDMLAMGRDPLGQFQKPAALLSTLRFATLFAAWDDQG